MKIARRDILPRFRWSGRVSRSGVDLCVCVCVSIGWRLWLIPRLASGRPEVVCHRDFAPDDGHVTDSSIRQLIAKANKKFSQTSNTCE